jgi:hypothetical protein
MKSQDVYVGSFLAALGTGAAAMAHGLGLGEVTNPGAGFIPFGAAVLLTLMSLGLAAKALLKDGASGGHPFRGIRWTAVALVLLSLAAYGAFLNTLGFVITTFLLMTLLVRVVGRRTLGMALLVSTLTAAAASLIFIVWLGVQMPKGFLGG